MSRRTGNNYSGARWAFSQRTKAEPKVSHARDIPTCLDGGPRHSWHSTGMDIVDDRCVYTARCDWCPKTAARAKQTDPPFRSSVRIKA